MLRRGLLSCALLCTASIVSYAQSEPDCTYNPDYDGDGSIGVTDLLGFLGFYGNENSADQCSFGPDLDCDGICDAFDDCIGEIDACGVCGGSGAFFPVIDTIVPVLDSVYIECLDGYHVYEAWADTSYTYVCPTYGCTDFEAYNYDPEMLVDDGSCLYASPGCSDGTLTVDFDGHAYDVVTIGDQCWFAENLRSTHYSNGDDIPGDLNEAEWTSTTSGAQAIYFNSSTNLETFGRLYNWYAVDDSRSLCPSGWHVPTDSEWKTLEMELGMTSSEANSAGWRGTDQGVQIKSSPSDTPSWNGTNTSGFSALAGGLRGNGSGYFGNGGNNGYWWSASPYGSSNAWGRYLNSNYQSVFRTDFNGLRNGFSVRCLRGE